MEWTSEDSESVVVARVHRASVNPELVNEYVHVRISSIGLDSPGRGIIKASAPLNEVELELQVGPAQSPGAGVGPNPRRERNGVCVGYQPL